MQKGTNPALPGGIETGCLNGGLTSINSCPEQQSEQFDPTAALLQALDKIEKLENRIDQQEKDLAELRKENSDSHFYMKQMLYKVCPEETQLHIDRTDILIALLKANNGKMLEKDARAKMHLSRSRFSELLATVKGVIRVEPYHLRKNQNVIVLKKSCSAEHGTRFRVP